MDMHHHIEIPASRYYRKSRLGALCFKLKWTHLYICPSSLPIGRCVESQRIMNSDAATGSIGVTASDLLSSVKTVLARAT